MKRRSKRRLAPTTRVDGVAGKRKRFRSGYIREFFGKTFSRRENFYQKQQQQKQRKNRAHYAPVIFLSLTRATEEEHAQQTEESGRCKQAGQSGVRSPSTGGPTQGHATSSSHASGLLQLQQTQRNSRGE